VHFMFTFLSHVVVVCIIIACVRVTKEIT
jgi:hypothetical protein